MRILPRATVLLHWPQPLIGLGTSALALAALAVAWSASGGVAAAGSRPTLLLTAALAGAVVVAYHYPLPLSQRAKVYVASVPYYLLAVLTAPPLAATAAAAGALVGEVSVRRQRGNSPPTIACEVGRRALVILVGALVAWTLRRALPVPLAWLVAALVLASGDISTSPLLLAPLSGQPPPRIIAAVAREAAPVETAQYLVGLLGALAATQWLWAPALLIVPTALIYVAFQQARELHVRTEQMLHQVQQARQQADAARQAAEDAVRLRDNVLTAVSHDLRNPLLLIGLQTQWLQRCDPQVLEDAHWTQALESMRSAETRMTRMIDDLLDLARHGAGQAPLLDRRETDLVVLARRVAAEYQRLSPRHRLRVESDAASLSGQWDGARLERALSNLLANAINYSPRGGDVVVRVRAEATGGRGGGIRIEVEDHGPGISTRDLPHIFERFHRGDNVGHIPGSGLGLPGVRQIVEQHGGTIVQRQLEHAGGVN